MNEVGLQAPWVLFARQIQKMFEKDKEVNIVCNEEDNEIKLFVNNAIKADALSQILPSEKVFGNIATKITVIPANEEKPSDLFKRAFVGNAAVNKIQVINDLFENDGVYILFDPVVVQYFADDISDFYGNTSTLYEDLAREIFDKTPQVHFCTDLVD